MPHKHKRKRGGEDIYDLPPSQRALPLPASANKQNGRQAKKQTGVKKQRHHQKSNNDAPRAFRRLMAFAHGKKTRSGLDNGDSASIRTKISSTPTETPRIKPGESMRAFSARVDAALPVAGLTTKTKTKDGKDSLGLKVRSTRKERKMHKLYDQWRAEERKIQERREEERELAEEREMETAAGNGIGSEALFGDAEKTQGSKKKGHKRGKEQDDDPWQDLIRKRGETKIGLHDVAQAPPDLAHKKMRRQLQIGGAAVDVDNVPKAAGSLRRREELQTARDDVVEAYRKIREHEQAKLDAQKEKG